MTTLVEIREENERIKQEIHSLVMRNTRLQREILTMTTKRELAAVKGTNTIQELTDELHALDDELTSVRAQCDAIGKAQKAQPSDIDRLGEEISNESSMTSTRFRRMSSAILGANGNGGPVVHGKPGKAAAPSGRAGTSAPESERSRGMSVASALKRRGSVMMRFKSTLTKKSSSSSPSSVVDDENNESIHDSSDDNHSVNIDELSPMPSPFTPSSSGSSTKSSGSISSSGGRPPLRQNSSANMLMYKSTEEKKSLVDSNPLHLNNFRRRERSSRKVLEAETGSAQL